jgi:hypothetical protein
MGIVIRAGYCKVCLAKVVKGRKYCDKHRPVSKYRATKTEQDGVLFDSKKEAGRFKLLAMLAKEGVIEDLRRQVRFPLKVNGVLVCVYVADFAYVADGDNVVEDVKGKRTALYNLKAKLFLAIHGFPITEV